MAYVQLLLLVVIAVVHCFLLLLISAKAELGKGRETAKERQRILSSSANEIAVFQVTTKGLRIQGDEKLTIKQKQRLAS